MREAPKTENKEIFSSMNLISQIFEFLLAI